MTLHAECATPSDGLKAKIAETLQAVTKLKVPWRSLRPAACLMTARSSRTKGLSGSRLGSIHSSGRRPSRCPRKAQPLFHNPFDPLQSPIVL